MGWTLILFVLSALVPGLIVAQDEGSSRDTAQARNSRKLASREIAQLPTGRATASWYAGPARRDLDLLVHFHGNEEVAARNFEASGLDAVLLVVNFRGLSSAYAEPFRTTPDLFDQLLETCLRQVREAGQAEADASWRHVYVSSFSAGYGAVREILKSPASFARIRGLLAADSIYAGLAQEQPGRQVDPAHMADFLRFARLAAESPHTKILLLTHSQLETPYASTGETADYLLQALELRRDSVLSPDEAAEPGPRLLSRAARGGFTVLGYSGTTGEDHLWHLREIHRWWADLHPRIE